MPRGETFAADSRGEGGEDDLEACRGDPEHRRARHQQRPARVNQLESAEDQAAGLIFIRDPHSTHFCEDPEMFASLVSDNKHYTLVVFILL